MPAGVLVPAARARPGPCGAASTRPQEPRPDPTRAAWSVMVDHGRWACHYAYIGVLVRPEPPHDHLHRLPA
ncbi:hypothetical protein Y09_0309 [Brachybacterium sp. SW0106-09]|nr:hypothetical protein Y09_0309 [Brachybacterium sp. SW0106-09]